MHVAYRTATPADFDSLIVFMREYYEYDHLPLDEAAARQALEKILRDHSLGRVWLISDGDETNGYVVLTLGYSLEYHGRDAFIDEMDNKIRIARWPVRRLISQPANWLTGQHEEQTHAAKTFAIFFWL